MLTRERVGPRIWTVKCSLIGSGRTYNYENGHARKQFTQNKKLSKHGASWRVPTCLPTNPATRVPHPYDTRANVCVGVRWILGLTRDIGVKKRYVFNPPSDDLDIYPGPISAR